METHNPDAGITRLVHVTPSGLVAAFVFAPAEGYPTAKNNPFPKATDAQPCETGNVVAVHVVPFGEVAAAVELTMPTNVGLPETTTNLPLP